MASTFAGMAFALARLGVVHAMAHPLGGFFDLPHGTANAILLPHVLQFNSLACPTKFKRMAALLGGEPKEAPPPPPPPRRGGSRGTAELGYRYFTWFV